MVFQIIIMSADELDNFHTCKRYCMMIFCLERMKNKSAVNVENNVCTLPKCTLAACNLKCSYTTAYDISVCQCIIIRSYTQIYVRGTLCIRRVLPHTLAYVGVHC